MQFIYTKLVGSPLLIWMKHETIEPQDKQQKKNIIDEFTINE